MDSDYAGRARREASAIVAEAAPGLDMDIYSVMVTLVAIGWCQGAIFGQHQTLEHFTDTFDELKAAL